MNTLEIKRKMQQAYVISFDIFDTLIIRSYSKPTDLFRHLEESEKSPGYRMARIDAEQAARAKAAANSIHEVTLDDIYNELHPSYRDLMEKEIRLEKLVCRANPEMLELYTFAKELNKKIVIASDMYLPQAVIADILHAAGYQGYDKLFLSSQTRHPKATGEMYDDIIADFQVNANQIFHIGDHPYTDYQVAIEKGLSSYCYEPIRQTVGNNLHSAYFAVLNKYAEKESAPSLLKGLITRYAATHPQENYWKQFGYQYIGPLACAYMHWLKERLDCCSINKVYFMLRDGYILKRVFDALYPDFETSEIYGSRRLFLLAGMTSYEDIRSVMADLFAKEITYSEMWDWLGLSGTALKEKYLLSFPAQSQIIESDADIELLSEFMQENQALLCEDGKRERTCLAAYLKKIGVTEGRSAIVDLGWKGSMLKSLNNICQILGYSADLVGFYLGTHKCQTPNLRMESYLIDHGISTGAQNADVLTDYGFAVPILELAFSAPHHSIIGVTQSGDDFQPVYQTANPHEDRRIEISQLILDGVMDFVADFSEIHQVAPMHFSKEAALAPIEYLSRSISRLDQSQIEQVFCCYGRGNNSSYRPIFKTGAPVIGIINPWPGDKSAEAEVLIRFKRAAEENDIGYIMLDNFGHILDSEQRPTDTFVDAATLSFVLTTHYETHKALNTFYYHTLWNPPEIPLNLDYYTPRATNQYIMNDDFLIYDSGGMSNHLRSMLLNCPRTLEGASSLTASFPKSAMLAPNLDNPTMFYCGMNWERVVHGTNRHEGLFKLLDDTGKVKFFGPERVEAWGGLKPWEGYRCYQSSIPFDGFSILKEINRCGICLVLSSDIHRRAGAATNRTYEACAAGAVMISDDNPFMLKHFKDAALFIIYNKNNPADTFRQIMEKYDWIVAHPKEALQLAKRAQAIFEKDFSADVQFSRILKNHPNRVAQIAQDLYAKNQRHKVLTTYILNTRDVVQAKKRLKQVFSNIQGQVYPNIELAIGTDSAISGEMQAYCDLCCAGARIFPMELYDSKGARKTTDGQAIRSLQRQVYHDYYINMNGEESWYSDHITTLIRAIEDSGALCSYSGTLFNDINRFSHVNFFDVLQTKHLFSMNAPERGLPPGQFLFSAAAHEFLPDYLFDCLDGNEHYAYANLLRYKHGQSLAFTKRMSLCFTQEASDVRCSVVALEMQRRFIQDLVRFDLPDQNISPVIEQSGTAYPEHVASKRTMTDLLLMLPIKNMILLRYYRFRMRRIDPKSSKYQKLDQKYSAVLRQYNEYWGS